MSALLESLNSIAWKRAIFLGVLLSFVYYFFAYDDGKQMRNRLENLKQEVGEMQQKADQFQKLITNQQVIQEDMAVLGEKFKNLLKILPQDIKSSEVVARIQKISRESGAYMQTLQVEPLEEKELYFALPVLVKLHGSFSEFANFIYRIGQEQNIIRVRKLHIFRLGKKNSFKNLAMNVHLVHYKYNPHSYKTLDKKER